MLVFEWIRDYAQMHGWAQTEIHLMKRRFEKLNIDESHEFTDAISKQISGLITKNAATPKTRPKSIHGISAQTGRNETQQGGTHG